MDEKTAYLWAGRCLGSIAGKCDAHLLHSIADRIASALVEATKEAEAELAVSAHAIVLASDRIVRLQDEVAGLRGENAKLITALASMRAALRFDGGELGEQGEDAR